MEGDKMAITSIMRENLGTTKALGTITLHPKENARSVLRKGTMFIRRNLAKREKPVSEQEIRDILEYLFEVDGSSMEFQTGMEEKEESDFANREDFKEYENTYKQYRFMGQDFDAKSPYVRKDVTWTQIYSNHRHTEKPELVTIFVGKPNQFKSARNGAIFSYRSIDGLTFQINLDRLVSLGVLVKMYKETGVIGGGDPLIDSFIRMFVHDTLPQSKATIRKNWGYRTQRGDYSTEEYNEKFDLAMRKIENGFKRAYRMELNIKSMEDYEKGLGKSVATAFETKKNIPENIINAMKQSEFLKKGFKFVELDEDTDLEKYKLVEKYYLDIYDRLPDLPLQALRFRKLGKHRIGGNPVSGLYSPHHRSIAVDLRQFDSFIHEYAHAIDYLHEIGENQSMQYEFTDILNKYEGLLPKDIDNKSYYLTPTEVFARGYEVAFRAKYPTLETGLMKTLEGLQKSKAHQPFYKNEELYKETLEYMAEYIN